MDLKSFSGQNLEDTIQKIKNDKSFNEEGTSFDKIQDQYGDKVKEMIDKFQGMSEPELLREIFKIINKQKQEGTFNPQKIKNIAQNIKPFLNIEQQEKLEELLNNFF